MRINENDDGGFNFYVSKGVSSVVKYHFPELQQASPTGWRTSKNYDTIEEIWIPQNRSDQIDIDEIKQWAEFAGNQCVWLKMSKHLGDHFDGDEIDCCVAADFNFTTDGSGVIGPRSLLGEAEFKLKYRLDKLSSEERKECGQVLAEALVGVFELLPLRDVGASTDAIISPIPSEKGKGKLSLACAKYLAREKELELIEPRLLISKPEMKELPIQQKIQGWKEIYQDDSSMDLDQDSVKGHQVVIVDDLYQSGTTMWAFASKLRELGAKRVFGLACVKSMKDSGNK